MKNQRGTVAAPPVTEAAVIENPLLEAVEEKPYSSANVQVDPNKLAAPMPEPQFIAPSVDVEKDIFAEEEPAPGSETETPPTGKAKAPEFNQTLNELSPKDQERSAEHAAAMIFKGYAKLHDLGNWWITISDDQVIKMQMDGEVDTSVMVPYTSEDWMPLMEFIQNYNAQAKEFITVDPEWRAEVEPALIRVLKKYKIGLTDEQFLMGKFGEDLISKGVQIGLMRKQCSMIIDFAREQSRTSKAPPLTAVHGGQMDQPRPAQNTNEAPPNTEATAGSAEYQGQGPVGLQDHIRQEMGVQGDRGDAQLMAGVERSQVPQYGDKTLLRKLNKVTKKRAGKKAIKPRAVKGKE